MTRGNHIIVKRTGYTHHGIDVGDGSVVHYTEFKHGAGKGVVSVTSKEEFAAGAAVHVREYRRPKYSPEEIVERALSRQGECQYSLFANNCEHFAAWCVTDEYDSAQVNRAMPVAHGVQAATAATGAVGIVGAAGTVGGLSGPGVMCGLAAVGPAGAVGGAATLAGGAGLGAALLINNTLLADNAALEQGERDARKVGRVASMIGAGAATAGGVGAIGAMGATAGLSAAGITSGLAAIGTGTGMAAATGASAMVAGTAAVVAGPVVAAAAVGYGAYRLWRWIV